jgi:dipeptidyl aminopeptidase/acylaminoacyl peptidase
VQLPDGVVEDLSVAPGGKLVSFTLSGPTRPPDVWVADVGTGEARQVTRSSTAGIDPATFVEPTLDRIESHDGLAVPVLTYRPPDVDEPPVLAWVHGGPESQTRPAFNALFQHWVACGWAVVAPNVRGSTGYGRTYVHLDDVDKRLNSVRDLAGLHDWMATQPDLDETRAALYGGSYGGYMVLAGLAFQPERWAAGVEIVGISHLVTFLENTSDWRRAFREREYGSLEHDRDLLLEASPITHVDAMRAPLFIIHGANDPRVPLSEAEQIHRVLSERGIRTELLVYDDEGHGLSKLANRLDAYPRAVAFLQEVLDGA